MKIGTSDTAEKVFVIAEIGNNHEGDFAMAERMIAEAAAAGANAAKFQTIVPEKLVARSDAARIEQLRKFQFTRSQFEKLKSRADAEGITFLSTPFDLDSALWLNDLVPAFKVASGDNTFWPLLDFLTYTGKPIILSTGLIDRDALLQLRDYFDRRTQLGIPSELALLHCVVNYPTADAHADLRSVATLAALSGITPGYSDHTLGIDAAILSIALGARIVEKHFTLDKTRTTFRDHELSADPADFKSMVQGIRRAEILLGSGVWSSRNCEMEIAPRVRRSIAAKADLPAGAKIGNDDLIWVRPATGLPPGREADVIGCELAVPVLAGDIFTPEHFKS